MCFPLPKLNLTLFFTLTGILSFNLLFSQNDLFLHYPKDFIGGGYYLNLNTLEKVSGEELGKMDEILLWPTPKPTERPEKILPPSGIEGKIGLGIKGHTGEFIGVLILDEKQQKIRFLDANGNQLWAIEVPQGFHPDLATQGNLVPGTNQIFICQHSMIQEYTRATLINMKTGKETWEGLGEEWREGEIKQMEGWMLLKWKNRLVFYEENNGSHLAIFEFPSGKAVYNDHTFSQW